MSLEFNPVGMACNIACTYCYEQPMRDANNITSKLDLEAAFEKLDTYNQPFSLFGGEPLLLSIDKLETIFKHGFEKWGQNGVQTNGTLINSVHMELFRRYRVHVGFSIDGPWPINSARCDEVLTFNSISNLFRCLNNGISASLIFTVTTETIKNAVLMLDWLSELDSRGMKSARIHLLEHDNNVERPSPVDLLQFLFKLERAELDYKNLRFDLFQEIVSLLQNPFADVTCVWNKCDPYTTAAVQGVGPSGESYNCGRTNKEGIQWAKAERAGHERQLSLYSTDCMDCRFFLGCKGYCPGTAIDGDWRRKTEHCEVIFNLFELFESRLVRDRIKVYTREPNLKEMELKFLNEVGSVGKGCNENVVASHVDWHIDGNTKTATVPVI